MIALLGTLLLAHCGYIIYIDKNKSGECKKRFDTQRSYFYQFSNNVISSDCATYYCAIATCRKILFGNATKGSSEKDDELMVEAASAVEQELSASAAVHCIPHAVFQVVLLESWKSSLPPEQQEWLSRALFIKDWTGRAVPSKELQLRYHPPGPRLIYSQPLSSPDAFFQRRFFL
ncbi:hypothetical protein XENOCAPTIV_029493 [Xenoophorus captivus]|uniref:DUF6729 domain-containing protein n=1 Tax=Xenoophorus captivus TaxID=1517983 RepID=A0ABV0QNQ6_9TELE